MGIVVWRWWPRAGDDERLSAHLLPAKRYSLGEHIAGEFGVRSRLFLLKSNVHRWRADYSACEQLAVSTENAKEPLHHKSLGVGRVCWRHWRITTGCRRRLGRALRVVVAHVSPLLILRVRRIGKSEPKLAADGPISLLTG
jgi:hypothetical protein